MVLGSDRSFSEITSGCGCEFVQRFIQAFKWKFGVSSVIFRNKTRVLQWRNEIIIRQAAL